MASTLFHNHITYPEIGKIYVLGGDRYAHFAKCTAHTKTGNVLLMVYQRTLITPQDHPHHVDVSIDKDDSGRPIVFSLDVHSGNGHGTKKKYCSSKVATRGKDGKWRISLGPHMFFYIKEEYDPDKTYRYMREREIVYYIETVLSLCCIFQRYSISSFRQIFTGTYGGRSL